MGKRIHYMSEKFDSERRNWILTIGHARTPARMSMRYIDRIMIGVDHGRSSIGLCLYLLSTISRSDIQRF
jgi:hypothetical protein